EADGVVVAMPFSSSHGAESAGETRLTNENTRHAGKKIIQFFCMAEVLSVRVELASRENARTQAVGQTRLMRIELLPRAIEFEAGKRRGGIFLAQVGARFLGGLVATEAKRVLMHGRVMAYKNERADSVGRFADELQNSACGGVIEPVLDIGRRREITDARSYEAPGLARAAGCRYESAMRIPATCGHRSADLNGGVQPAG